MLFNDRLGSLNQPPGEPAGDTRTFSAVSAYSIDSSTMTAREAWYYEAGQRIYPSVCSSALQTADQSLLIDYAIANNVTEALIVGLVPNHHVVFEFE